MTTHEDLLARPDPSPLSARAARLRLKAFGHREMARGLDEPKSTLHYEIAAGLEDAALALDNQVRDFEAKSGLSAHLLSRNII